MTIEPLNKAGSYRTATLMNHTVFDVIGKLGFEPNVDDDPDKVTYSWGFEVDGVRCGVWDYKGSYAFKTFSLFGPKDLLKEVFGEKNVY